MFNLTHVLETASLVLVTYLLGCVVGYAVRWILYAGRGTRTVTLDAATPAAAQPQRRVMTPAARLAAMVSDEPMPPQIVQDKSGQSQPRPKARPVEPASKTPQPVSLPKPRASGADDLKQIKGIGPKIEVALNGMGVYHLDQIADWSKANVEWVDRQLAFKGRIGRERWVEQAIELTGAARKSA